MNHSLRSAFVHVLALLPLVGIRSASDAAGVWNVLTVDPMRDTKSNSSVDAAQLSYRYDHAADMLWFRVAVYGTPDRDAFGVQIAINTGSDVSRKAPWWGANKEFRFDRLVTARVTRSGEAYRGTIGVADAEGALAGNLASVSGDGVRLSVERDAFIIGVRRAEITAGMKMEI